MEDTLNAVKSIGMVGAVVLLIRTVVQARPITLLTANPIELKLIDKDTRYYVKLAKAAGEILFMSLGMLVLMFGASQISIFIGPINRYVYYSYILIIFASFCWSTYYLGFKKKTPKYVKKYSRISVFIYCIYVLFLMLFPPFGVGMSLGPKLIVIYDNLHTAHGYTVILLLWILFGIASFGSLFLWKLASKVFEIDKEKEKALYIKIDGEKWFIQNHLRKNYIYLTDNQFIDRSERIRFIKWEEILERTVYVDNYKSERINELKLNDSSDLSGIAMNSKGLN